jgi:hypothetical protein
MVVLDMHPHDAILGFDWPQAHSSMNYDWQKKTLEFSEQGSTVKLQGLQDLPLQLHSISATKVYNSVKGNDVWAFVLVDQLDDSITTSLSQPSSTPPAIHDILQAYADVFHDPKTIPPQRVYDHTIPLVYDAIPINSKPYHYSPHHKTEIERQVKELLQAGLITHSHSPTSFISQKEGWILEILCGLQETQ